MMIGMRVGLIYYLCRQNKGRGEEHNPLAWASNPEEEKDSLDHSATGHYIKLKDFQITAQANI